MQPLNLFDTSIHPIENAWKDEVVFYLIVICDNAINCRYDAFVDLF